MTASDFRADRLSGYHELSEHLGDFVGHADQGRRTAYYQGYARARAFALEERDEALAKLEAIRALMAPEATLAAMAARGFVGDGPVDHDFLAAFGDYSLERTAAIRKALA